VSYTAAIGTPRLAVISTYDANHACIADGPAVYSAPTSGAWPTQYLALYVPMRIGSQRIVRKLGISNGATASGNLDLGLYDAKGTLLVSTGSTAQSGEAIEQIIDVTDTLISPGIYYIAAAMDGTTGTFMRRSITAPYCLSIGVLTELLGSVTLPATATWTANQTLALYPMLFMAFTTAVA